TEVLLDEDHPGGARLRRGAADSGSGRGSGRGHAGQVLGVSPDRVAAVPEGIAAGRIAGAGAVDTTHRHDRSPLKQVSPCLGPLGYASLKARPLGMSLSGAII